MRLLFFLVRESLYRDTGHSIETTRLQIKPAMVRRGSLLPESHQ